MRIAFLSSVLLLASMSQGAIGALVYDDLATNALGNFVNPGTGWAGTGTVVGAAGFGSGGNNTMIEDFTGTGVLTLGPASGFGTTILTTTTGTMSVTLGGGSGDVVVNLTGGGRVVGFNITDLKGGVTSVIMEINWSEPIAPAYVAASIPQNRRPFLGAFRTQTGSGTTGWNFTGEYLGLRHTTSLGGPFIAGLPAGLTAADSVDMLSNGFNWGSGSSFSGTSSTSNTAWEGIHLFDIDGDSIIEDVVDSNATLEDGEAIYGTGIRFTFTKPGGAILDGNNFIMSTNGSQYDDTFTAASAFVPSFIPEPRTALLLALGLLPILLLRRRERER